MRSDARKRMHPAPHWDPTVVGLIEKARADERAPFEALARKFKLAADHANDPGRRAAYRSCADDLSELLGGAS